MFKYFRALWYFITGRFSAAAEALQENKYVMQATFDAAIDKRSDNIETVKNAVAKMMGLEKTSVQELRQLTEKAEKFQRIKKGSGAKAKERAQYLQSQGKSKEEILTDSEMLKHQGAFQDASSSYEETQQNIVRKEKDIEGYKSQIATYKVQLQNMQRNLKNLKGEKQEALAKSAIAKETESINSILAGIEQDSTDKDLASVRESVKNLEAKAQISAELAGTDAALADQEYENYAAASTANSEFADMLGLTDSDDDKKELGPAELPE